MRLTARGESRAASNRAGHPECISRTLSLSFQWQEVALGGVVAPDIGEVLIEGARGPTIGASVPSDGVSLFRWQRVGWSERRRGRRFPADRGGHFLHLPLVISPRRRQVAKRYGRASSNASRPARAMFSSSTTYSKEAVGSPSRLATRRVCLSDCCES